MINKKNIYTTIPKNLLISGISNRFHKVTYYLILLPNNLNFNYPLLIALFRNAINGCNSFTISTTCLL